MENIKTLIESTFKYISLIPVYGDNVDIMMAVRNNLKRAFVLAEKAEKEAGEDNG